MATDRQPSAGLPPDPEPSSTPGLLPGGGIDPGDTPPDSGQETQPNNPHPAPRSKISGSAVATMLPLAIFLVLAVAAAVLLILKMCGVFG